MCLMHKFATLNHTYFQIINSPNDLFDSAAFFNGNRADTKFIGCLQTNGIKDVSDFMQKVLTTSSSLSPREDFRHVLA